MQYYATKKRRIFMKIKSFLSIIQKIIYLTCAMLFCFAIGVFGSGMAPISMLTRNIRTSSGSAVNSGQAFVPLLIFSLAVAILFAYIINRSRWYGLKLALAIFVGFFGLMTVVPQLESLVFLNNQMPPGLLRKIFLMGFYIAALFSLLAVFIMGKVKKKTIISLTQNRLAIPITKWLWKSIVIGLCYVVIYITFGYFVAWQSPIIQQYYGGHDPGNFLTHLNYLAGNLPYIIPFQFFRGLLWMLFALPIIQMHTGKRWEVGLTIALLFTVWNLQLFIPNPVMPPEVARIHFFEMVPSNFIFGWVVGLLLS
jgi:hypothetical protein